MKQALTELAHTVEAALVLDRDLSERVRKELKAVMDTDTVDRASLDATDDVIGLIAQSRPGWSLSLRGVARQPNGHWKCSLRRAASRDDDEYLGTGRGPTLPHALLAALLKALAYEM